MERITRIFPYGAWAFVFVPEAEWESDVKRMKEVGLNTIAIGVGWGQVEASPRKYSWERIDRIVGLAKKYNMKILMSIGAMSPPYWFTKELKDGFMMNADGDVIRQGGVLPPQVCFDHPRVRDGAEKFLRRLVERYKDEPTIVIWETWGEPHLPAWDIVGDKNFCFCMYTRQEFREWLKKKYRSIKKLNDIWKTPFTNWVEIDPPTRPPSMWGNEAAWIDWRRFMAENLAEAVSFVAQTVKRHDPTRPTETHVHITCAVGNTATEGEDYWLLAKDQEILGCSFFVKIETDDPPLLGALTLDTLRSAAKDKKFMVTECQGGYMLTAGWGLLLPSVRQTLGLPLHRGVGPTPEEIKIWSWQAIAHGAKGFIFWCWRPRLKGYEYAEWGLCNIDGTDSKRVKSVSEVAKVVNRHAEFLLDSKPSKAHVAILRSLTTQILAHGEAMVRFPSDATAGAYRALWEENIPVDLVDEGEILEGILSKYRLLIMPFAYTMNPRVGERIQEFVKTGGSVFADGFCAMRDEHGGGYNSLPGGGLSKVFRCKKLDTICMEENFEITITKETATITSLPIGSRLNGYMIMEKIEPLEGGDVIARFENGWPAIIVGKYGEGKSMYVGTFLTMKNGKQKDANVNRLLVDFVKWCGIESPVKVKNVPEALKGSLEVNVLEKGRDRLLVAINHNDSPVTGNIEVKGITGKAVDLEEEKVVPSKTKNFSMTLSLSFKPKEVKIVKID